VLALLANTEAEESGRKTNVVYVSVEDFDPHRAAEAANALCKNYIRRSVPESDVGCCGPDAGESPPEPLHPKRPAAVSVAIHEERNRVRIRVNVFIRILPEASKALSAQATRLRNGRLTRYARLDVLACNLPFCCQNAARRQSNPTQSRGCAIE